jgi:hypothetical protein
MLKLRRGVVPFELCVRRHTCLTRWAKMDEPLTFHRVAGHVDMKTPMRYVHPSGADMDKAVAKARRRPLITKYDQRLQRLYELHTDVPVINNMGKLLSLKEQLPKAELDGVLTQLTVSALLD